MADKDKSNGKNGEKTYIKGLGFCSFGIGANVAQVDVKDGKVLRIRPLHFDEKYDPKTFNQWKIKARGKVFKPSLKSLLPPLSLAYKKRVLLSQPDQIPAQAGRLGSGRRTQPVKPRHK